MWNTQIFNYQKDVNYNRHISTQMWVSLNKIINVKDDRENIDGKIWKGISHYITEKSTF
jgi:hypothetical protein